MKVKYFQKPFIFGLFLTTCLLALSACQRGLNSHARDNHWVSINGHQFDVELAMNDQSRAKGLMFRDALPESSGMLFVFEKEMPQSFWMKNTHIPLDILYFDEQMRLVSASLRTPPCRSGSRCPPYPSTKPAMYVLEINAGLSEKYGFQLQDELKTSPSVAQKLNQAQ